MVASRELDSSQAKAIVTGTTTMMVAMMLRAPVLKPTVAPAM
jgi:hypothetical protein